LKLLFDANLSPKLARHLQDLFPGSSHVFDLLVHRNASDREIWDIAKASSFAIVSADRDFLELSRTLGPPPRVIHIAQCGYRTHRIETALRRHA
jgi:predicted nuclease of predicted toxin-antitoxin system